MNRTALFILVFALIIFAGCSGTTARSEPFVCPGIPEFFISGCFPGAAPGDTFYPDGEFCMQGHYRPNYVSDYHCCPYETYYYEKENSYGGMDGFCLRKGQCDKPELDSAQQEQCIEYTENFPESAEMGW
jgi:hypothetical protein